MTGFFALIKDKMELSEKSKEVIEITWVNASENYFNLMAKPMGLESDDLKIRSRQQQTKQLQTSISQG